MRPVLYHDVRRLDPAQDLDAPGWLLIDAEGRIAGHGTGAPPAAPEAERIAGRGRCLAPGLVDLRVDLCEPGAEHKETFLTGCSAAVAGGVTSLACLPDTAPPIDDPAMVEFVARRARQQKLAKVYPYGTVTRGVNGQDLTEMVLMAEAGAIGFCDGGQAIADAGVLKRALTYAIDTGKPIVQHPEEPSLAGSGVMNEGEIATRLGLAGIPAVAEAIMVARDVRLAEATGGWLHISRVTTAEALDIIRRSKARGVRITCDTAPHYFTLNELAVEGYRSFAKVSPPLRVEADRVALAGAVADGTIDAIASDHRPQDQDSKRLPFAAAAFGVIGVETLLSVSLNLVHNRQMPLLDLIARLSTAPARLLGLDAGTLRIGAPADLVLFDAESPWKITEAGLRSKAKNTPFEGALVQGRVAHTRVDGRLVYDAGMTAETTKSA